MKRILMGTTALVAAGAFAGIGATQAQDMMVPMKAGVGGYYTIAAISTSKDGTDDRGHGIQQNIELQFQGDMELDNGITAGVRIRISGNTHEGYFSSHEHGVSGVVSDEDGDATAGEALHTHMGAGGASSDDDKNISETEVYFKGAFGALHAGMIESAAQQMATWAPGGTVPIGGIKSPWFGGVDGGMWTSNEFMNEDSPKIVYFTPSFNGLSVGVSYSPEGTLNNYGGFADNDGRQSEQVAASVGYSVDIMGGSFSANLGYESYTTEADGMVACMGMCDPKGLRYGATVSIDQISIGGAIYDQDADGTGKNKMDRTMTDVGISWSQGPLMLGIQHGSDDRGSTEHDMLTFNANYTLGPGVDVGAVIATGENDGADITQFLLGTMFNF